MFPPVPYVRVLLNPTSGRHASRRIDAAIARLKSVGWRLEVVRPKSADETRALGADPEDFDATILSGGDGTISTFLQDAPLDRTVIGILPCGTANVVARDLYLPLDSLSAAEVILRRRTLSIDVCEARWEDGSSRRFVLSCSTGTIAQAVADVSPSMKKISGQGAYAAAFLSAINSSHSVSVMSEGGQYHGALAIALLTRHYAGGFVPLPDSATGDGFIDLFILDGSIRSYAGLLLGSLRTSMKSIFSGKHVTHIKVRSLSISSPGPLEMDGDPIRNAPIEISVIGQVRALAAR